MENAYKDITIYDDNMNIIGHEYGDGELKTQESYRTIPMNDRLKQMLIKLKKNQKARYNISGKAWSENEYVFLNTEGGPFVPERLTKKITTFIKKYDLEHMTVYGFRHSFATLNSEKGMDKEVLRELMGHTEFETTDFYYVHISEERKQKEFDRIHNKSKLQDKKKEEAQGKTQGKRYFIKRKNKTKKVLKLA